jgi:ATP-dependent helicase/nuclease subunit A
MTTFNANQQRAIDALGKNILVSASAGAGKTTVLINRLIKRMEVDRVSVDRIMAVTFTELAAKEMRKRLENELLIRVQKTGDEFLKQQVAILPSAAITTIHGFCLEILKKYAYVLSFDPQRAENVIDDTQKAKLMDEAFSKALDEFVHKDLSSAEALAFYFSASPENIDTLKTNVFKLASKLKTVVDEQAWLDRSIRAYEATSIATLDPELRKYLRLHFVWRLENLINLLEVARRRTLKNAQYVESLEKEAEHKKLQLYDESSALRLEKLGQLRPLADRLDYHALRAQYMEFAEIPVINPPKLGNDASAEKAVRKYNESMKAFKAELFDEETWAFDYQALKPIAIGLTQLTQGFARHYDHVKTQAKVIDFDDMEQFTLQILRNTTFNVVDDLRAHFQEILVDEFQDTNFIQNAIVELLSNGTNVFRVGDVKQSIYRFRNAQPELMQGLKSVEDDAHEVLYLTHNYRSTPTLVTFNNVLFSRLMNFAELESSYVEQDNVEAGLAPKPTDVPVSFHFIEKDEKTPHGDEDEDEDPASVIELQSEEDTENVNPPFDPYAEAEAEAHPKAVHIANTIVKMRQTTEFKNYKDYVVLVRSNAIKAQLKAVFEDANIPHHISVKSGFYNSDAVQDVLLVMNFLTNPYDNITITGLLLSAFIGMSNDELARLKLATPKTTSFWESLKTFSPKRHEQLSQFTAQLKDADLVDTLRAIYRFNDYYGQACTLQQRANLDYLMEKAQHYAKQNTSRIEFMWLVKTIEDEESSEAIPFTEEDDVVRVMTIHQSKGLEFNVVFFWSQGRTTIKDNQEALLIDSRLGFSLKSLSFPYRYTRKNPIRLAMEMKTIRDDVQEQVRLLYVALTRAKKRLIIVDLKPGYGVANLHYTSILNSLGPTNWMLAAFPDGHETLERHEFLIDGTLDKAEITSEPLETLTVMPKPQQAILFKAPSATHKTFAHFKLNFDPSVGTNHGTMMHELFEHLPAQGVTREMIQSHLPEIAESDIQAVLAFYADPIITRVKQAKWIHEFPFYALIDQQVWHGYMDLVIIGDGDITLIDYKTDRVEDPGMLVELYQDQLLAYVRVLRQMHPDKTVYAYLYSLKFATFIPVQDPH